MNLSVGYLKVVLLVVLIASSDDALAKDLGLIGPSYPIIERDLIDVIHARIQNKIEAGELDALHQGLIEDSKSYAARPPGTILPRAQAYRAVEINPVYTLEQDITDADGKVLFKAGTQVNPLHIKPLSKMLCFIDGDDLQQVAWVKTHCSEDLANKLILVNGDYLAITKQLNRRLYFDQQGYLIARFDIRSLPAVIRQSGEVLYLEEFPIY